MSVRSEVLSADEWEQLQMAAKSRLNELKSIINDGFDEDVSESDRVWAINAHKTMVDLVKKIESASVLRRVGITSTPVPVSMS